MTNPNYTAICLLIDRSGSMASIQQAAEDGVNEFVKGQAAQAGGIGRRNTIRIAQFDTVYDTVQASIPASVTPPYRLIPRNGTALLDAMGKAITEFGAELAAMGEKQRPGVVILAVMTDGAENSSFEYSWEAIEAMVQHQENTYQWQILYLGANQDAIAVGARLGIHRDRAMTYAASAVGTRSTYDSVNTYAANASSGVAAAFTDEDREAARKS